MRDTGYHGPPQRHCFCCGQQWGGHGDCVQGPRCDCSIIDSCPFCQKCKKHCICERKMEQLSFRAVLPTSLTENIRRVEQSIVDVYLLYGYGTSHSYQQIQDACNVLCSRYPEPALGTLAMLKGGYPHYVKEFMSILETLASPAKAELVKDKPE